MRARLATFQVQKSRDSSFMVGPRCHLHGRLDCHVRARMYFLEYVVYACMSCWTDHSTFGRMEPSPHRNDQPSSPHHHHGTPASPPAPPKAFAVPTAAPAGGTAHASGQGIRRVDQVRDGPRRGGGHHERRGQVGKDRWEGSGGGEARGFEARGLAAALWRE